MHLAPHLSLWSLVTPPFKSVLARLPLRVTCQVAKGVIFFIEGEDYSLKFTDGRDSKAHALCLIWTLLLNRSLKRVPQVTATVLSIPEFTR